MELVLKIAILLLGTMICTLVFLITYKVRNRNSDTSPLQAALEQKKE